AGLELHHVVPAQALDQLGRRAFGNDLAVVDDREPVAQAFGLVHVMRGQQHCAAIALKVANNVPELAAALRIESGRRFVEKKNSWISHERRGYGQALALSA